MTVPVSVVPGVPAPLRPHPRMCHLQTQQQRSGCWQSPPSTLQAAPQDPAVVDVIVPYQCCRFCTRQWSESARKMNPKDVGVWKWYIVQKKWANLAQSISDSLTQSWYFGQPEVRFKSVSSKVKDAIQDLLVDKSKHRDPAETWLVMHKNKDYCQAGCIHCQRYEEYMLEDLTEYLHDTVELNARSDAFLGWLLPILGVRHDQIMWS